jgi:hypothetical protein
MQSKEMLMSAITLLILLSAGLAVADDPSPGGNACAEPVFPDYEGSDIIYGLPFLFETLEESLVFTAPCMISDDFTCLNSGYIDFIEIWAVYIAGGGNPSNYNIELRGNGSSGPGSVISSHSSIAVNHSNTGYTYMGCPLWYTEISVNNIWFTGETQYWIAIQTTGNTGWHGWLCTTQTWGDMTYLSQDNGASWESSLSHYGAAYGQFMVLSGSVDLSRNSWGAIKTLF